MMTISMKRWLGANERTRVLPTDKWYLDFAIKSLPIVRQSALYKYEDDESKVDAAISLAMYFQDAIAQNGGWKAFSNAYYERYGSYLPFYKLTDEYVPDEINKEDIAFVLWTLYSQVGFWNVEDYTLFDPLDEDLLALSQTIYEMMDACFEEAPVSEGESGIAWVMGVDLLDIDNSPLPEIKPDTKLSKDVVHCLEYSKGNPLLYFATYEELCTFFVEVLKWENKPDSLLPDLKDEEEFVIYANAKGILVAHGVAAFFCEERNPMYDAKRAAEIGYCLFCEPGACPFDLVKYGMAKDLLPEVTLPFPNGRELLLQNWDFIARYYLCEYYEGE